MTAKAQIRNSIIGYQLVPLNKEAEPLVARLYGFKNFEEYQQAKPSKKAIKLKSISEFQERIDKCKQRYKISVSYCGKPHSPTVLMWDKEDKNTPEGLERAKRVLTLVTEQNIGRNLDCWPIFSFGGKDVDLDPEGCTGIASLVAADNKSLTVQVGGHKAFFPSEERSAFDTEMTDQDWLEHSILCDFPYNCEWEDDRWMGSFRENVKVTWKADDEKTAEAVIRKARQVCNKFSAACIETELLLNSKES